MTPTTKPITTIIAACSLLLLGCLGVAHLTAATGTITPSPFQLILDNSGNPVNAGCIWTYTAGTSTPVATYTDVALSVANANPIIASTAGRFTAFLTPGLSYKFTYENTPCSASSHGSTLVTADNIAATPASAANVDTTGTAGEAISAGQAVYLSDGSGGKIAGQWYKADSANAYSTTANEVGMAPSAIGSGATGTIRLTGVVTGLSLTVGAEYFVGSTGAITSTAPALRRHVGHADTATSLVLTGNPAVPALPWIDDFRLSLTTATPVTTADVTAATTLYLTPLTGNRIDLPDTNGNPQRVVTSEISIAMPATTSTLYDVFAYLNGSTATLELLAWTNDTTRATAVVRTTNGRLFKSGDNTRLYLGSVRTTTVSGQTEDSAAKRYLWNYYNRVRKLGRVADSTDSWTYTTATYRQANASTANQLDIVIGIAEVLLQASVRATLSNSGGVITAQVSIGEDSTTTPATGVITQTGQTISAGNLFPAGAELIKYPVVGRHVYVWLERSQAAGTTTWYGDNADGTLLQSGIHGWIEG